MKRYQLGLYEKAMPAHLSWPEKLRQTKISGFDFLEISIDETDDKLDRLSWSDDEIAARLLEMVDAGVFIRTMCLSGHRKYPLGSHDPAVRARGMDIMEKAVILAWKLGVRMIQLAGYDVYYEQTSVESRRLFQYNLSKAVSFAAAYGITMGFETMETPFMDTVRKAMAYVQEVDSPYLGIYPDIGNLTNAAVLYRHHLADDIATGAGHLFAAHLKETKPGLYREIPFGTGHTDFIACVRQLYHLGVRLYTGEFWYVDSPDWEQDLAEASRFLREQIEAALPPHHEKAFCSVSC